MRPFLILLSALAILPLSSCGDLNFFGKAPDPFDQGHAAFNASLVDPTGPVARGMQAKAQQSMQLPPLPLQ